MLSLSKAVLLGNLSLIAFVSTVAFGSVIPESHIPAKVAEYADQGKLEGSTVLPVTVALSLNNEDELDQRLAEMYRPGSESFHQFITPEEFRARYAPTTGQIEEAKAFLSQHGMIVSGVSSNGHFIQALGNIAVLNDAFQTEVHQYKDVSGNKYFAPAIEPNFPKDLTIRAVHGLDNVGDLQHTHIKVRALGDYRFAQGSGPQGGLTPNDFRMAYQIPAMLGNGQVMALVELDGYDPSDIQGYDRQFGLQQIALQNILMDGATGTPGAGAGEVTLDIEVMSAVAPASQIMVYEGKNSSQSLLNIYSKIASDNTASTISTSWGQAEGTGNRSFLVSESNVFKQMASQGQSFYAAAGDSGAYDNKRGLSVDDPASQPYVVGVGGTKLTMSGQGGAYVSETTWNNGSPQDGAGGGGISKVWPQQSWQNGLANAENRASATMRNVPDVSFNADPETGYAIYLGGQWQVVGGTSAAAPIWAAFTALVNQERASLGKARLGFPSPLLYEIGKSNHYAADFHDIADGSTNLGFPAVAGYDDATGWGSFQGAALIQDLSAN